MSPSRNVETQSSITLTAAGSAPPGTAAGPTRPGMVVSVPPLPHPARTVAIATAASVARRAMHAVWTASPESHIRALAARYWRSGLGGERADRAPALRAL